MNYPGPGMNTGYQITMEERQAAANKYIAKTYLWLFAGLLVSFGIGFAFSNTSFGRQEIERNPMIVIGLLIAYIVVSLVLSLASFRLPYAVAGVLFFVYAVLQGFCIGFILLQYELSSAISVFAITAAVFGIMAIFGMTTKKDLTGWGSALFFSLIGLIIMSFVGMFLNFALYDYLVCAIGLVVFVLYTAYDTQQIKRFFEQGTADGNEKDAARMEALNRGTVMGGFRLMLNYVNIFLYILRLLGKRR